MHCSDCKRPVHHSKSACIYCGGSPIDDRADFRAPLCIDCKGIMKPHPNPDMPVLQCNRCKSLWFGRGILEQFLEELEVKTIELDEHDRPTPPATRIPQKVEYRRCPSCDSPMKRENYLNISGIIVDTCFKHGTYLDAGELEALVAFIQAGGVAASKHQEAEEEDRLQRLNDRAVDQGNERKKRSVGSLAPLDPKPAQTHSFSLWDMLTGIDSIF